jgi:hypothetical protein
VWQDAAVAIEPVIVKPQFPALSKAARRLAIASVPWFFLVLLGLDAIGLIGRGAPEGLRWPALLVAIAPIGVLVFHPLLGRIRGLRWLHHRIQPRMAIRADRVDLRLPDIGERSYGWDEVGALRMRPDRAADLLGRDGVAIAKIPETMILAGGTWWRSESIASIVVRVRPDLYRLSGANWAGVPNAFALRTANEPSTTADPWVSRRRLTNIVVAVVFVAGIGFLVLRYLTS